MDITDSRVLVLGAYSLVLGVFFGMVWGGVSFLRILITAQHPTTVRARAVHDLVTFFCDVFYALFTAICTVFLFFGTNNGRIRLLGIAGCAAGFAVYHYTVGKRLIEYFSRFVGAVRRAIAFVWRHTIGALARMILRLVRRPIRDARQRRAERRKQKARAKRAKRKREYTV